MLNPQRLSIFNRVALLAAFILLSAASLPAVLAHSKTHAVVIEAMQFSPKVLEVSPGDTVIWINKDAFPHNVTSTKSSFSSGDIATDGSWKFKAGQKGFYPYVCTLHPTMQGTLLVK